MTSLIDFLVTLPPALSVLLKITLVLTLGWILHLSLLHCNPRWRVLLWRGVAVAVIMVPILVPMTYLQISVSPPAEPAPESIVIPPTRVTSGPYMMEIPYDPPMGYAPMESSVTESTSRPPFSFSAWALQHRWKIVVFGWGFVVVLLTIRLATAFMQIRRKIAASFPAPDRLHALLDCVARDLKCSRKVSLRYSSAFTSPFLAGLRNPLLVLPKRMTNPKYAHELPAIFAHELAHVRSNDLLWILIAKALSTLLWFHPLAWWLPDAHTACCEEVCDAVAADHIGNASSYSSTLARIALDMAGNPRLVAGIPMVRSSQIITRLRILKRTIYASPLARHWVALSLLLGAVVLVGLGGVKLVYSKTAEASEAALAESTEANASQQPDDGTTQRIRQQIYILRHFTMIGKGDVWAGAIRELAEIGPPAVPELLAELQRDTGTYTQSTIAVALRAIGDPRAIPGVIHALAKAPYGKSDYGGLMVEDPEILKFMKLHSKDPGEDPNAFGLGRPISEITRTLEKLTGHTEGYDHLLDHDSLGRPFQGSYERTPEVEKRFVMRREQTAEKWQAWWEIHKHEFLKPAELAEIESWQKPTLSDPIETAGLKEFGPIIPYGHDVSFGPVLQTTLFFQGDNQYLDFESGLRFTLPEELQSPKVIFDEIFKWRCSNGIDVWAAKTFPTSKTFLPCIAGNECIVWPLDSTRWDTIDEEIRGNHPPALGQPRARFYSDPNEVPFPYTFLFKTAAGGIGVVQNLGMNDQATGVNIRYKMMKQPNVRTDLLHFPQNLSTRQKESQPRGSDADEDQASIGSPTNRIIGFPKDRSLGQLSIQTRPIKRTYYLGPNYESISEWEYIGEAMGDVTVPGGRRLQLLVSGTSLRDLSPLSKLQPDDLYMLGLYCPEGATINADDQIMPHIRGLTGLENLSLSNVNISPKGMQFLKDFKSLKNVRITCPTQDNTIDTSGQLDDQGLAQLAELKSLETLFLVSKNITDEGLRHLAKLPSLRELYIYSPKIKGPGLAFLANIPSLMYLNLRANRLGDAPLQYLKNCKTLKRLELGDNDITDAGLAYVSNLTQLEELDLLRAKITNEGLVHLRPLRSLKLLDLAQTPIDDDGVFHLKDMKSLEDLDINTRGKPLTDKGLAYVSELSNLKRLSAGGSSNGPFTDEGLKHLSNLQFLEQLTVCGAGITDEGMSHIAKLTNLKKLLLMAESVTNEGLGELTALKSLNHLWILSKKITLSGLNQLNALPNLTDLNMTGVLQDHAGLDISGLTQLENLCISLAMTRKEGVIVHDQFRDEDVACLAKLTRLRWLQGIRGIGDAGMAHLAGLTSLERFNIGGPDLTDDGLKYLAHMKNLNHLTITGDFTDQGLRHLDGLKALSLLRIYSANNFSQEALKRLRDNLPHLAMFQADVDREIRDLKQRVEIATVAPPFTVETLDGNVLKLEDYRGKVVLLYFWATWCSPCVASTPALKEFYAALRGHDNFMMIGLSIDDDESTLREFVTQHGLTWPQVRLGNFSKVAADYGVSGVPSYIIVGQDGKILLSRESNLKTILSTIVEALKTKQSSNR
jgi:beta-lactamase regulating signal transducer with metallopeptidase domain/peroxiredoxin/Leucine-rich repeat (LRR) protein